MEIGRNISHETISGPPHEQNRTESLCFEEILEKMLYDDEQNLTAAPTEEQSLAELTATTNGVI